METLHRLARALGSLSTAADLGAGQPAGTGMRASTLAVRIARKLQLSEEECTQVFYGGLLSFTGCTATLTEASASSFGEDAQLFYAINLCNWRDPKDLERSLFEHYQPNVSEPERAESIRQLVENYDGVMNLSTLHCKQACLLAERLPLPFSVTQVLQFMLNRWDGDYPGPAGAEIPQVARIVTLANNTELIRRAGGKASALEMIKQRSGHQFDPALSILVLDNAEELFDGYESRSDWDLFLESEPENFSYVRPEHRVAIAQCFADYVDQKSGWLFGHSRQVASLAMRIAGECGLDAKTQQLVYLAGLLHDIGRIAIPNRIWEKPDLLNSMERREAENHNFHTSEVLELAGVFDDVLHIAESAHERVDGSGYHRRGKLDNKPACCLATADIYAAISQARPWRSAFNQQEACELMIKEVKSGRLPNEAIHALFRVIGETKAARDCLHPAGLTNREADILGCLVKGMSNKEIARQLSISPKTAENHLTRVYNKTDTNSRAQAALFALEHGILSD